MTGPVADPVALPHMVAVLACLEDQIRHLANPPAVVSLRPGDRIELLIAQNYDECCAGLGWVRCVTIYPSTNFPAQDDIAVKCQTGWAVVLEFGIARCAPRPEMEEVPSAAEWAEVTGAVMADAAALRRTLMLFRSLDDYRYAMLVPGQWTPLSVEGGCVGGSMTVTLRAPMCDLLED